MKKIPLPFIIIGLAIFFAFIMKKPKENRVDDNVTTRTDAVETPSAPIELPTTQQHTEEIETESIFSGNRCAECGKKCLTTKEMYSSGDARSSYEPYYLCGDMNCVNTRYEKVKREEKYQQQEQEYRDADAGNLRY